jgi:hypothetical protein
MSYTEWLQAEDKEEFLETQRAKLMESEWQIYVPGLVATAKFSRRDEYPDLGEQLDMLWHAMDLDESKRLEPWYSTIKLIKSKYPKP